MTVLTEAERQRRIESVRKMTPGQAKYIADLVDARYEADAPERAALRRQWDEIQTNEDVSKMIMQLKAVPTLQKQAPRLTQRTTKAGYYRNPETGELYRLSYGKNGAIVSKYSETGGPRRLLTDLSQVVKGTWKLLGTWASRQALSTLRADWLIDPAELAQEFAYGFCPFHHGPLTDGVSVILGYGKDCAEKNGLPWSEEAAQAVLAATRAAASK